MVQVLNKAFDIVEMVVQRDGQAVSLPEISETLQINQATAANIINTLVFRGYLEHIGKKKGYRLGPSAYRLTNEIPYEQDLVVAARPVMGELTAKLNESCILGVLRNHKRYILHAVNAQQEVQVQLRSERGIYETASGRLLLAYLSEKELDRYIVHNGLPDSLAWAEGQTKDGLLAALEAIKQAGLVKTHIENRHVKGYAVPVFKNEIVVAGLSVFAPEYRCTPPQEHHIIESLKQSAAEIGQKLIVNA
jgi:IclR family transcriptional regulator, KDG regulon repressor